MEPIKIGAFIQQKRKLACLTQLQMANCLGVSPQAVSKWERGEGMPDIGLLLPLSTLLDTSVDMILCGGNLNDAYKRRIDLKAIVTGMRTLANLSNFIGKEHLIYQGIIEGINEKMNVDIENYLQNDFQLEAMVAEIVITEIQNGGFLDRTEVQHYIHHPHWQKMIYKYQDHYHDAQKGEQHGEI